MTDKVLAVLKEGLSAWKAYLSTRQEAYNRKMDKRQEKAIRYAEEAFQKMRLVFDYVHDNFEIPADKASGYNRLKTLIYKLHTKFNKFD